MEFTKALMWVAVIAVVVSAGNLIFTTDKITEFSGYASSDTGTADVEITDNVDIVFSVASLDWGGGYVTSGTGRAELNSTNSPYYTNWTEAVGDGPTLTGGLELQNIGNVDADLWIELEGNPSFDTIDEFICNGHAGCIASGIQEFNWWFEDLGTTASCSDYGLEVTTDWTGWTPVEETSGDDGRLVCDDFNNQPTNPNDFEIEIDFQLMIPEQTGTGPRQTQITATAATS